VYNGVFTGWYASATAVNALRFFASVGNILSGTIRLYGILKTAATPPTTVQAGAFAARPTASLAGRLYFPTDGFTVDRDNGASWDVWGPVFPLLEPSDTGFSWVNQGTSTLAIDRGRITIRGTGTSAATSSNWVLRVKSLPAAPYTITFCLIPPVLNKLFLGYGVMLRQAGAGTGQTRFVALWWCLAQASGADAGGMVRTEKWTNQTTFSASYFETRAIDPPRWFRIQDDGTNLTFSVSADDVTWMAVLTVARLDWLLQGPDQFGFGVYTHNNATPNLDVPVTLVSLSLTTP
jgi:hypothetical protein